MELNIFPHFLLEEIEAALHTRMHFIPEIRNFTFFSQAVKKLVVSDLTVACFLQDYLVWPGIVLLCSLNSPANNAIH